MALATKVTLEAVPSLLLIIIVMGGIVAGAFTATECAIVAVVCPLFLSVCYKTITFKNLMRIYRDSSEMTGIIILLIGASSILSWVISFVQIPDAVGNMLKDISDSRIMFMLIIKLFLLFIVTFLDTTPAVLIFTPIFLPVAVSRGLSPVEFGIIITFNLCIGLITPPAGNILFVCSGSARTPSSA